MRRTRVATLAVGAAMATLAALPSAAPAPAGAAGGLRSPAFLLRTRLDAVRGDGLVAGDLDGDGRDDLVSWASGIPSAAVRLSSAGDGTFALATDVAMGGPPSMIRIGHVDAGPTLDLIASIGTVKDAPSATGLAVALGNGDGTFAPPIVTAVPAGSNPRAVAVGDLTGDGTTDAVVGDATGVTVATGDGTGTFALGAPHPSTYVNDLAIADVTGDGTPDVIASTSSGYSSGLGTVRTYAGTGGGALAASLDRPTRLGPYGMVVADVDEDGLADVLVAVDDSATSKTLSLLRGVAGSGPAPPEDVVFAQYASLIAVGDVDGDGHLDVAGTDIPNVSVVLARGHGDGTFDLPVSFPASAPRGVVVGDLLAGAEPDLAVLSDNGTGLSLYRNLGAGSFASSSRAPWGGSAQSLLAAGDATGDGLPDLLVGGTDAGGELVLFANDGNGQVEAPRRHSLPSTAAGIATCRLDADPWPEVIATTTGGVSVLKGLGGSELGVADSHPAGGATAGLVATDLDGDGTCDLAVANPGTAKVSVLLGDGAGGLGPAVSYDAGTSPKLVRAGDIDDDGDPDLVALSSNGAELTVLRNGGDATFPTHQVTAVPGVASRLAVGELDRDGRDDVALTVGSGPSGQALVLLAGSGGLGAATVAAGATSENPFDSLASGDVNGDGNLDLVVASDTYLLGRGDGTFERRVLPFDGDRAAAVVLVADADGNGTPDFFGRRYDRLWPTIVKAPASEPPWAPFASWAALITRQHADLLGRPATGAELAGFEQRLRAATLDPGGLVAELRAGADNTANVDPVACLYRAYFLRNPDPSGLRYWIARRREGRTLIRISESFARSSEFTRRYGALTNRQFVDLIYLNVLGRAGDQGGVAYWTKQLDTRRKGRGQVMLNFSESSEYRRKQSATTDTSVLYLLLLGRAPTAGELATAIEGFGSGRTVADLAGDLLSSAAYAARVTG